MGATVSIRRVEARLAWAGASDVRLVRLVRAQRAVLAQELGPPAVRAAASARHAVLGPDHDGLRRVARGAAVAAARAVAADDDARRGGQRRAAVALRQHERRLGRQAVGRRHRQQHGRRRPVAAGRRCNRDIIAPTR